MAEETTEAHLGVVERLAGVQHADALGGDVRLGLQLIEDGRVAEGAAGPDLFEQGRGRLQAGLAEGDERAGGGERPITDLRVTDQIERGGAQGEPAAQRGLTRGDERGEVHRLPAAGEQRLRVGDVGADAVGRGEADGPGIGPGTREAGADRERAAPGVTLAQAQVGIMEPIRRIIRQDLGGCPAAVQTVGPGESRVEDRERDIDGVEGAPGIEAGHGQAEVMLEGAVDRLLQSQARRGSGHGRSGDEQSRRRQEGHGEREPHQVRGKYPSRQSLFPP